jgi:hypothetical protein
MSGCVYGLNNLIIKDMRINAMHFFLSLSGTAPAVGMLSATSQQHSQQILNK